MNRIHRTVITTALLCTSVGCSSTPLEPHVKDSSDGLYTYRNPSQMQSSYLYTPPPTLPIAFAPTIPPVISENKPNPPVQRPLPVPIPPQVTESAKPEQEPDKSEPTKPELSPEAIIEQARHDATQYPTANGFINAREVYDFEPGAVYKVMSAPGFVTVLRLRPGESMLHLAAGDTSRWLIDTTSSGDDSENSLLVGPQHSVPERVSILIKPRKPSLETNLVILTDERTYLIDLTSASTNAYHSVVEWTYPKPATVVPLPAPSIRASLPARDDGTRNFVYSLKAPLGRLPPWSPGAIYDDGHRVHVEFSDSIQDVRRPPLFVLDKSGNERLVNYRTVGSAYVVDELFERAVLRLGEERVVIERTLPAPFQPFDREKTR